MQTTDIVLMNQGEPYTTSLVIADLFHKRHKHVLRDIRELVTKHELQGPNFRPTTYQRVMIDGSKKHEPLFHITRNGALAIAYRYSSSRLSFEIFQTLLKAFEEKEQIILKASHHVTVLQKLNRELQDQLDKANVRLEAAEAFMRDDLRLVEYTLTKVRKSLSAHPKELTATSTKQLTSHSKTYDCMRSGVQLHVEQTGMPIGDMAKRHKISIVKMKNILKEKGVYFSARHGMYFIEHRHLMVQGTTIIKKGKKEIKDNSFYLSPQGIIYFDNVITEFKAGNNNPSAIKRTAQQPTGLDSLGDI